MTSLHTPRLIQIGREYIPPEGEVVETYANVITAGLGGRGEAQIVKRSDSDGR